MHSLHSWIFPQATDEMSDLGFHQPKPLKMILKSLCFSNHHQKVSVQSGRQTLSCLFFLHITGFYNNTTYAFLKIWLLLMHYLVVIKCSEYLLKTVLLVNLRSKSPLCPRTVYLFVHYWIINDIEVCQKRKKIANNAKRHDKIKLPEGSSTICIPWWKILGRDGKYLTEWIDSYASDYIKKH